MYRKTILKIVLKEVYFRNEEAEYIQTRLPFMSDGGADGMWLGVSDSESDGVFKWSNGMLDEEVQYKKWGTNQPRTRDVKICIISSK